jgi:hypothetical protein
LAYGGCGVCHLMTNLRRQMRKIPLTKDDDFLAMHREWQRAGQDHFGIFYCPYRDRSAIGLIVKACKAYHDLIAGGAGAADDIKNEVMYIT